jgi:hypothetical protein
MATDASLMQIQELGHALVSKVTAQMILVDLLVETTEGEATSLALQLADELRQMADLAERIQAIGRGGPPGQSPD